MYPQPHEGHPLPVTSEESADSKAMTHVEVLAPAE